MPDATVDLVDLNEVSAYLEGAGLIEPIDLDKVITGVSSQFAQYTNRNFVATTYSRVLNGHGGDRMSLPDFPITAVSAVTVDGVPIQASATPVQSGFVFSETQVLLRGYRFCRGVQNVAINYTAGFSPIPADLRRACCEGVAAIIAQFQYNDPRVIEAASGGTKIKLGAIGDLAKLCLTANVTEVLEQRKRVHPA